MTIGDLRPNQYPAYYLMMAYAYYELDEPIASDEAFDTLSKLFKEKYDEIDHPHKYLITTDMLEAGTYIGSYPEMVKGGYESLNNHLKKSSNQSIITV